MKYIETIQGALDDLKAAGLISKVVNYGQLSVEDATEHFLSTVEELYENQSLADTDEKAEALNSCIDLHEAISEGRLVPGPEKTGKMKGKAEAKKEKAEPVKTKAKAEPAKKRGRPAKAKAEPVKTKAKGPGKPGIIAAICQALRDAKKSHPKTKEEILRELVEKFPDRDKKKMWNTILAYVPWAGPHLMGIEVGKVGRNPTAYYTTGKKADAKELVPPKKTKAISEKQAKKEKAEPVKTKAKAEPAKKRGRPAKAKAEPVKTKPRSRKGGKGK